ncbi:haloacid dehalogenase type II [Microbacterium resistens]|uniref:haloacid dehalogenase type II n=1 Tax=Microbacterium resistens TaxID=156977 RepID=UPI0008309EB3|nr:haloacid dehalogenase type II [Microbacterium resistens]MBW1638381.1 haloacid dehalogenase type II [Microbacterium resistens]
MIAGTETVVFDVLGTLVDEPGGVAAAIGAATGVGIRRSRRLAEAWLARVAGEQRRIADGKRPFVGSSVLDAEAAVAVTERVGGGAEALRALAVASRGLPAWPDSAREVSRLSRVVPVIGLSNADEETLAPLARRVGLPLGATVSAERAAAYKPSAAVYRAAVEAAGVAPERILMVAAHAWDLRGAQAAGMRVAYVPRPGGDEPTAQDRFDAGFASLGALVDAFVERERR